MLDLAAILHTHDPFLVDFGGGWGIRWYGLSYLAAFAIGYLLIRRVARVGISTLAPQRVGDLVLAVAIGVVVGGRLGYVFFYQIDLLWTFSASPPWWNLLAINKGGMASHGGMLGGMAATALYAWRHGHRWGHLVDLFAFGAPPGLFLGRLANYLNGELLGRAAPPDLPWAVKFPQEILRWPLEQREALLAALEDRGVVPLTSPPRAMDWIIAQVQQGNRAVIDVVEPMLTPLHPSQLYAAIGEGLVVWAVLLIVWARPRKPFVVGSLFCLSYAAMRILDEQFRQPDEHLGFQALGLTRGQWLSFGLIAVGVLAIVLSRVLPMPLMGGWRRAPGRVGPPGAEPTDG